MSPLDTAKPPSEQVPSRMALPARSGRFAELAAIARRGQSSRRSFPFDPWQAEREAGPPQ